MSSSQAEARAEAIREILARCGHSRLAAFFIEKTDIDPATLRGIAGVAPPPTPQEQREVFRSLLQ